MKPCLKKLPSIIQYSSIIHFSLSSSPFTRQLIFTHALSITNPLTDRPRTIHPSPQRHHSLFITLGAPNNLEADQVKQLKYIFCRFDMDRDGSLTILELASLLTSLGLKPSGNQIHVMLANMDSNGNGSIEFDELINAILPDMSDEPRTTVRCFLVFRLITTTELAGSMSKMGRPLTYKELTEMMREADMDGDGVINFNEFASTMAKSAADFLGLTVS